MPSSPKLPLRPRPRNEGRGLGGGHPPHGSQGAHSLAGVRRGDHLRSQGTGRRRQGGAGRGGPSRRPQTARREPEVPHRASRPAAGIAPPSCPGPSRPTLSEIHFPGYPWLENAGQQQPRRNLASNRRRFELLHSRSSGDECLQRAWPLALTAVRLANRRGCWLEAFVPPPSFSRWPHPLLSARLIPRLPAAWGRALSWGAARRVGLRISA